MREPRSRSLPKNTNRKQNFTYVVLAFLGILVLTFFTFLPIKLTPNRSRFNLSIPKFELADIEGIRISSKMMKGNFSLLAYIDDRDPNDLAFLEFLPNIENKFSLNVIAFARNLAILKKRYRTWANNKIRLIDATTLPQTLRAKLLKYGHYHIYNKNGKLVYAGTTVDKYFGKGALEYIIRQLMKNERFLISSYIRDGTNLGDYEYLSQLASIVRTNQSYKFFLFIFFRSFYEGCGGGTIVRHLNLLWERYSDLLLEGIFLAGEYDKRDIPAIRSQAKMNCLVFLAGDELRDWWDKMAEKFSDNDLTGFAIFADRSGMIFKTLDNGCSCAENFFDDLEKVLVGEIQD